MKSPRSLDCWWCGSELPPRSDVGAIIVWLQEHEHTPIEREAARIVQAEGRRLRLWT